jgi:hypothetical protein
MWRRKWAAGVLLLELAASEQRAVVARVGEERRLLRFGLVTARGQHGRY